MQRRPDEQKRLALERKQREQKTGSGQREHGKRFARLLRKQGTDGIERGAVAQMRGRETLASPAAAKRQGSSTACVIPTRVPTATSGSRQLAARPRMRTGPRDSEVPFSSSQMPSACVSLPGPEQRSRSRAGLPPMSPRLTRICPILSSGASARISTAAPTPSPSQTALSGGWIPYE